MMTPEEVAQLNADQQRLAAARETDVVQDVHARFGAQAKMDPKTGTGPIMTWLGNLPKNIGVGLIDAAVNTTDMVRILDNPLAPLAADDDYYLAARQHVLNFRDEMATNSNTSDKITQALAQYMIPWLGFMKVAGIAGRVTGIAGKAPLAAKVAGVVMADALTSFSVYKPHDTRFADVLALAKHTEGKLGAAMNTIAPDGSLLNAYIDYMTDRSTEGEWEGRVKNVMDNFALSVAGAGLIAAGGATLKAAFKTAKYAAHNVGAGPVGLGAQKGMVGYHGTRHDFPPTEINPLGEFDLAKIGTGEGAQAYGHGIYIAGEPRVGERYTRAGITSRINVDGKPYNSMAVSGVESQVAAMMENRLAAGLSLAAAKSQTEGWLRNGSQWASIGRGDTTAITKGAKFLERVTAAPEGFLLHVDIPDEQIAKMLDWDKPLSEQAHILQAFPGQTGLETLTGKQLYENLQSLGYTPEEASKLLSSKGIPGIKYLDAGSRAEDAGSHTRNMVLFDPKIAKIVKKE